MTDHDQLRALYPASSDFVAKAHVNALQYEDKYAASVTDPETFWGAEGKRLDWITPYTKVKNTNLAPGEVSIKWLARVA